MPCRGVTSPSRTASTCVGYKSPSSPLLPCDTEPAAVTIAAADEHLAPLVPVVVRAQLKLPPAPRELARPRVVLVVPPARRITVPGGRPIDAADELRSPRDPRANQPFQDLHWVAGQLTVPRVVQLHPYLRRSPSSRDHRRWSPPHRSSERPPPSNLWPIDPR
jgi:hypothetical protein